MVDPDVFRLQVLHTPPLGNGKFQHFYTHLHRYGALSREHTGGPANWLQLKLVDPPKFHLVWCVSYNNLQPNLQHHPVTYTHRKMWLSSNNLAWRSTRTHAAFDTPVLTPFRFRRSCHAAFVDRWHSDQQWDHSWWVWPRSTCFTGRHKAPNAFEASFHTEQVICSCILWLH